MYYTLNYSNKQVTYVWPVTLDTLQLLNKQWLNIYRSCNSFLWSRQEKDLTSLDTLGFDIDTNNYNLDYYLALLKELDITTTSVVKTFKWFHIHISLSSDLNSMSLVDYKELHNSLSTLLNADKQAKTTTLLLKVPGFIDYKDWREFLVTEIFNSNFKLSYEKASQLLKRNISFSKYKSLKEIKYSSIENIDALELITKLNLEHYKGCGYDIINLIDNGDNYKSINFTDGLKLYFDSKLERWRVIDFTGNKRFSNKNFLFNYVFKEDKVSSSVGVIWKVNNFLSKNFWITLNESFKSLKIPKDLALKLTHEQLTSKTQQELEDDFNKLEISLNTFSREVFTTIINGPYNLKVLLALIKYYKLNYKSIDENKFLRVEYKDFLKVLGLSSENDNNKRELEKALTKLSTLKLVDKFEDDEIRKVSLRNLLDVNFGIYKATWKNFFEIKYYELVKTSSWVSLSNDILLLWKGFSDKLTRLVLQLQTQQVSWSSYMKIEDLVKFLELTSESSKNILKSVIRNCDKLVETKVIKKYTIGEQQTGVNFYL